VLPLDRFHVPQAASPEHGAASALRDPVQHGIRPGWCGVCRKRGKPAFDLDQLHHCRALWQPAPAWPRPFGGSLAGAKSWWAGSTGSRCAVRSSAKACSAGPPMLRKSAWSILSRNCVKRGFVLLDTQFTTEHLKRFRRHRHPTGRLFRYAGRGARGPRTSNRTMAKRRKMSFRRHNPFARAWRCPPDAPGSRSGVRAVR
jgi:hypothetical protein